MLISDMVPYSRNARRNAAAVPAVAESIASFGLRGQIVLESRENPVIVCGHTRVEACKSLGWDEIPDANIAFCDGMTDEEIRAFRLADNKTGEMARWDASLLRSEMSALAGKLDMSRYGFGGKGAPAPRGASRLRTDDAYNLRLVSAADCDAGGMPRVRGCMARPPALMAFNYAKSAPAAARKASGCHFFIDDYQFERVWNRPEAYVGLLKGFDCVTSPDFSLYMDMPLPMQRWNEYRRRALMAYWQREGVRVVPTLSWSDERSYGFCFAGLPRGKTAAVSSVGVKRSPAALSAWRSGMGAALKELRPRRVLLYGGNPGFDFGGIEVVEYEADAAFGKGGRRWAEGARAARRAG